MFSTQGSMAPLSIPLQQPVTTGLIFFIWDIILLAFFIDGTSRIISWLNSKRLQKRRALNVLEVEVAHFSGGIAGAERSTQIVVICFRMVKHSL